MGPLDLQKYSEMMVIKVHLALDSCTVREKRDAVNCTGDKTEHCEFFHALPREAWLSRTPEIPGGGPDENRDSGLSAGRPP